MKTDLTWERLIEVLSYDKDAGIFRWKITRGSRRAGTVAGNRTAPGQRYWGIMIDDVMYRAHRLAWLYMTKTWPHDQIDHINLNGHDNRFINLREASNSENRQNSRGWSRSGFKGIVFNKTWKRWVARIIVNGKFMYLGGFDAASEAAMAYDKAATEHFGQFARLNFPESAHG